MATAPAAPEAAPKGGGSKKLIIIVAAVLVLVLVGGAAAFMLLKKKPVEEGDEDTAVEETVAKPKAKKAKGDHPPTFVPLDPFTVNLADKDVDRFAQIGITLEVEDPKFAEQIKAYICLLYTSDAADE